MSICPGSSASPSVLVGTPRTQEAARAQRVSQVQHEEERLRNWISPVAVAGIVAILPSLSVSLVSEVAGFGRTLTCHFVLRDGYNLTQPFLEGPSQHIVFEPEDDSWCLVDTAAVPIFSAEHISAYTISTNTNVLRLCRVWSASGATNSFTNFSERAAAASPCC